MAFNLTYQTDFHPRLWRLPYTKVRASLSIGSRFHSNIVCSWWLFHIWCRVSSQVGVVRISWYQSKGSSGLAYPFYSFSVSIFQKKKLYSCSLLFFLLLVLFLFSFLKSVTIVVNFFVTLVSLFKSCSYMCLLLLPSLFVSLFSFSFLKKKRIRNLLFLLSPNLLVF